MDEIKQFKSLDDLKKIISDLEGFYGAASCQRCVPYDLS